MVKPYNCGDKNNPTTASRGNPSPVDHSSFRVAVSTTEPSGWVARRSGLLAPRGIAIARGGPGGAGPAQPGGAGGVTARRDPFFEFLDLEARLFRLRRFHCLLLSLRLHGRSS